MSPVPFCPHQPTEKQQTFLELTCREALYGGSVGGGKSEALLMAALQYVHVPGYAALLLRRTYADLSLPGALMDRAGEWLRPTAARWRDSEKTWEFPSGAKIAFGYLETEGSHLRYQSSEWQYIAWDELSQFSERPYRYLFSRLRRLLGVEIPIRMRAASNPGSEWVKDRFGIRAGRPEAVQWTPEGRAFVPARLLDNPHLDAEEYQATLAELDPITLQQLLQGDWDVRPAGKLFRRSWFRVKQEAPAAGRAVRAWDLAATAEDGDYTRGVRLRAHEGQFIVEHVAGGRWRPHERDQAVLVTAAADGRSVEIAIEQEPGSGGKAQVEALIQKLAGYRVRGVRSTGPKITRAGPFASQAEAGNVMLLEGDWISSFLDELEAFPTEGVHDDQVDAASLAFAVLTEPRERPGALPVGFGVKGWQPAGLGRRR